MVKSYQFKGETVYMLNDQLYTEQEWNQMEADRKSRDFEAGYRDRIAHVYDKWYRYNRHDDGKAYDEGVQRCVNELHTKRWMEEDEGFHIIECN